MSIGLFVLLGVPMVAYLWETLNQLLALRLDPRRLLISLPVLAAFVGLLAVLGRTFRS